MAGAGRLRERITFQSETLVPDGGGGSTLTWSDLATVWAEVAPLNGRERLQAQQVEASVDYRVTIRYRVDVTAGMRLIWGSAVMNVRAIYNEDRKRAYLTLDCESGVAT